MLLIFASVTAAGKLIVCGLETRLPSAAWLDFNNLNVVSGISDCIALANTLPTCGYLACGFALG